MSPKRSVSTLILILFILLAGCREQEETPTTPQATDVAPVETTDTAVAQPTDTAVPQPESIGLLPLDDSDDPAPKIIGQNPALGEELPLDGALEIYFDQPMNPEATAAALQITDSEGTVIEGDITWPQPRVLQFKPRGTFKADSTVQAVLEETAVSAQGSPLLEGLTLDFYTIGDLAVSQIAPVDGAGDVAIDSAITVIFNRPVVPLLIAEETAELPNPLDITPATSGHGQWLNTSVYLFRPDTPLIGRETYTVRVQSDIINEISATGAQMAEDYLAQFTVTAPTYSYLNLVNRTTSPEDNYKHLPLDQSFQIIFNQPMDPASSEAAIGLNAAPPLSSPPVGGTEGGKVDLQFSWDEMVQTVTFTPTQLLGLDTDYTLELNNTAQSSHGGQLRQSLLWHATTVLPPAIRHTIPADGETADEFSSLFTIQFVSPMDGQSMTGTVQFDPPISGNPNGQYDRWSWQQRYYGLAPSTAYTVTILPEISDPYGNTIDEGQTVHFTTAAYRPSAGFNFPDTLSLYRRDGSTAAWITHRNVEQLDINLYSLTPQQFSERLGWWGTVNESFVPDPEQLVWQQSISVTADLNERDYQRVDLLAEDDVLPPGLYFISLDSPQVRHELDHIQAQPLIMATANVVLKTTLNEALIWVTDLTSGQPLADVPVTFYTPSGNPVFSAETDANGLAYRDDITLNTSQRGWYYAVAEDQASDIFGFALQGWNEGVNPYDFGINTDFYLQQNQPTAYVYTERPIYRPGQEVSFKGIIRLNDDLDYSLPDFESVQVVINSYDGPVFSENMSLSELGSFAGQFTLGEEATLGSYAISVQQGNRYIGSGRFDVADYRAPTFQVNVTTAQAEVIAGDTINLTTEAQFFSGGAVVDGEVSWYVSASPYFFQPGGNLSHFGFNNDERDNFNYFFGPRFGSSEFIASGEGRTDSAGRFTFDLPALPPPLSPPLGGMEGGGSGSRTFTIENTVTDVAGTAVSGRTNVIVHRSLVYPGIRPLQVVGEAGDELGFELTVVDWEGNELPERSVSVEVVERRWYSVQEENEAGETIWRSSVEEIAVADFAEVVTGENGRAQVSFTPDKGGVYRAYIRTHDNQGREAIASTYIWVSGGDYVPWRRLNDHSFELISGQSSYQPGDTAEILIASPFQGQATALVTVERGHIRQTEVLQLSSNSTIYRLPITGDMAPNIFVSVMVVKGVDETNPSPDFKVGMTQFTVEREEQELQVEIIPDGTVFGPRDTVNYTVRVSDHTGQPVDAELSLAVSDLAALSIADRVESPILDFFYSNRWLSVNTALLLTRIMDSFNQELEEEIKGGGGGDGDFGVLTVRQEFPDTAYWQGQERTGPDGEVSFSVELPDSLTTWRLDVRAVTADTLVGENTADIMTTRPLLVSPTTPRFFVVGDRASVGTAVHNNSDGELTASVTLEAEGVTLNSPAVQEVTIQPNQQAFVTWEVVVQDVTRVDFTFSASSGDLFDASKPTLATLEGQGIPVFKYEVPATTGTSGQLLDGGAVVESIGLPIFPGYTPSQGDITIAVAPSLAAAMIDGLEYLRHYPYECTEQIISSFLPNVLTTRALKVAGINNPTLEDSLATQVNIALQRLYSRQHADGGWPWWEGPESSTLVTAYVVLGLLEAQASEYEVSQGVIDQGVAYLRSQVDEVEGLSGRFRWNRQAFIIYVLAHAGEMPTEQINNLYEMRETLDLYAQGYLARAIHLVDPDDPRLETMAGDFISHAILSATGANWEEAERDYWNWNSDTRTTAIVLGTMIQLDPDNPIVANAVRWLMAHRENGRWASTQETAWTLMALTDWMVASGELEADYQYEIALNGESLGSGTADASTLRDTLALKVDITELFTDELNRLAIGRSDGPGNLYYTTHLEAYVPVEQVQAQDRGIIISRSYFSAADSGADDRDTPISQAEQGETFLARLTIIIPNTLHYVVIDDFLPAGLEAVDQSLRTSQQVSAPDRYDWDDYFTQGWGWWYFNHVELRDEKVVISADYLPAGTYEYVYLVRASTPGEFRVIPPTAQEFYFPEVYGRGAGSLFVVEPR